MINKIEKLSPCEINEIVNRRLKTIKLDYCGDWNATDKLFDYIEFTGFNLWGGDRRHFNIELKCGENHKVKASSINIAMCITFIFKMQILD